MGSIARFSLFTGLGLMFFGYFLNKDNELIGMPLFFIGGFILIIYLIYLVNKHRGEDDC